MSQNTLYRSISALSGSLDEEQYGSFAMLCMRDLPGDYGWPWSFHADGMRPVCFTSVMIRPVLRSGSGASQHRCSTVNLDQGAPGYLRCRYRNHLKCIGIMLLMWLEA